MNANQATSDRPPVERCPDDVQLREFDAGTLAPADAERLSEHMARCQQCSTQLTDQRQEDTRLMAELFTPGTALVAEQEFQKARRALLNAPETVSAKEFESAESTVGLAARHPDDQIPGQVGSYRLRYELGRGAMGIVYRARHVNLKRDAALKILNPRSTRDQEIVQRFYGEMEALGQLRDAHIVQAYDAGESSGVHFLAMEYVDGADAARLCAHAKRLSVADACEIAWQAALGLETARHRKLIHRDVKPSNLMVGRNGQVKILDLGLASIRQEDWDLGLDDDAVGTVDYMAPEQWQGSPQIDIRADIYSLGCTLFKLLTGRPPFYDSPDDGVSKMQAHTSQPAPALREIRREVPRELESLVARMLSKKPKDRFNTPRQVAEALHPYHEGSDLAALVEQCVPAVTGEAAELQEAAIAMPAASRRRPKWGRWAVAAAAAMFAVLATIMIEWLDDGTMVVKVDPAGAKIQIGALSIITEDAGEPVEIRLDGGQHELSVTKEGFKPHQQKIEIRRGSDSAVNITLAPESTVVDGILVLRGHRGPLQAVEISPDGTRILTGSNDRTLRLWDAKTGKEIVKLAGHEDIVWDVIFTPDGQRAVSASKDRTARLWDLESGEELQQYSGHREPVRCVAISEDGKRLLTGSGDCMVRMWDLESGELLATLGAHRSFVRDVTFLPGSQQAVSCSNDRVVILWDLDTRRMRRVMQGHSQFVHAVSAALDGQYVVTGSQDSTLRLWDLHTARQQNVMRLHTSPVQSVKFIPGSNFIVSCSNDRDVRVWNPFSGECIAEFIGHEGNVTDIAVNTSAGLVVSASADRTARVEKLPSLGKNPTPEDLVAKSLEPTGEDAPMIVRPLRTWTTGQKNQQAIVVLPDGQRIATAGDDGVVRIWETKTGQLQREMTDATDGLLCIVSSADGQHLAAAGKDSRVYVWEVSKDEPAKVLNGHKGWVTGLAYSADGERLLSGGFDATMRVWDLEKGQTIRHYAGQAIEWIHDVVLGNNRNGPLTVSGGNAGIVRSWTTTKGRAGQILGLVRPFEWPPYQGSQIACVAATQDGKLVAAAGWNRPVRIWNVLNGRRVSQFGSAELAVCDLAWCGDNRRLLTANVDGTVRFWDRNMGKELKRFLGHTSAVRSVSLSAGAQVVASTGEDGMICLWPSMSKESGSKGESESGSESESNTET